MKTIKVWKPVKIKPIKPIKTSSLVKGIVTAAVVIGGIGLLKKALD